MIINSPYTYIEMNDVDLSIVANNCINKAKVRRSRLFFYLNYTYMNIYIPTYNYLKCTSILSLIF